MLQSLCYPLAGDGFCISWNNLSEYLILLIIKLLTLRIEISVFLWNQVIDNNQHSPAVAECKGAGAGPVGIWKMKSETLYLSLRLVQTADDRCDSWGGHAAEKNAFNTAWSSLRTNGFMHR